MIHGLDHFGEYLAELYESGMKWSLRHPIAVFVITILTIALTAWMATDLPREILPQIDEGIVAAQLKLPEGTSIEETARQAARIEEAAKGFGAHGIYSRIGNATDEEVLSGADPGSSATAQLIIPVPDGQKAAAFAAHLRTALPDLAQGQLALDLAGQSEFGSLIGREGRLVRVELSARTLDEANKWADTARRALAKLPTLSDVRDAYAATQPIIEIQLERDRLTERGISPTQVTNALAGGLGGVAANEFRETDRHTPIAVRYAGLANEDLQTALNTMVNGIPVGQLVRWKEMRAPLEVVRVGQRPVSIVEALIEQGGTARATTDVQRTLADSRCRRALLGGSRART